MAAYENNSPQRHRGSRRPNTEKERAFAQGAGIVDNGPIRFFSLCPTSVSLCVSVVKVFFEAWE
jgi:hypothetical protein